MFLFIVIIIFCFILLYAYKNHLHIDFISFFRKGFKKISNKFGVFCYTGKQGTGKTYSAVDFCIKRKLESDYRIITNVKSFNIFKDTIYMDNIMDIIKYCTKFKDNDENVLIFFDEIFTVLEKGGSLAREVLSFISQLRKRGIIFVTTAQEWSEINITLRRYVRFQISCNMISLPFTKTALIINQVNDGDKIRWDNDLQDFVAPIIQTNIAKGKLSIIESYDTYETIKLTQSINSYRKK